MGWLLIKKHPAIVEAGKKLNYDDLANDSTVSFQKKLGVIFIIIVCSCCHSSMCYSSISSREDNTEFITRSLTYLLSTLSPPPEKTLIVYCETHLKDLQTSYNPFPFPPQIPGLRCSCASSSLALCAPFGGITSGTATGWLEVSDTYLCSTQHGKYAEGNVCV